MSNRWLYKVVELEYKMFGGKMSAREQAELDKLGAQGWELVAVTQAAQMVSSKLYLKKQA